MRSSIRKLALLWQRFNGAAETRSVLGKAALEQARLIYCAQFPAHAVLPLAAHSESAFSQNGEDGIIAEIFRRLGHPARTFVEFGAGNGFENNTIALVLSGAAGLWIEGDSACAIAIRRLHATALADGRVKLVQQFVTVENINALLREHAPAELDLLSIDIDGNDYWIWKAIDCVRPKVIIAEYNARLGSSVSWTMAYDPAFRWNGTSYFGASISALEKLGREKQYTLVGADFSGVNAFFVRDDLITEAFPGPHTAQAIFHPFRAQIGELVKGHEAAFGPYANP